MLLTNSIEFIELILCKMTVIAKSSLLGDVRKSCQVRCTPLLTALFFLVSQPPQLPPQTLSAPAARPSTIHVTCCEVKPLHMIERTSVSKSNVTRECGCKNTVAEKPTVTPSKIVAPMPTRTLSSTVAAWMIAPCPGSSQQNKCSTPSRLACS